MDIQIIVSHARLRLLTVSPTQTEFLFSPETLESSFFLAAPLGRLWPLRWHFNFCDKTMHPHGAQPQDPVISDGNL